MTPRGLTSWIKRATKGRQIIYHQGTHLMESDDSEELGRIAREACEHGDVHLFQKRLTPATGVNPKRTRGTFAYIAVKR